MDPDLDDTVIAGPRSDLRPVGGNPGEADLDDTIPRFVPPPEPPVDLVEPGPTAVPIPPPLPVLQPEETAVAPPFRARFVAGGVVDLDAPVYIGRRPSVPRVHAGSAARLVTVSSPAHEVSATHLELRVIGDTLVANDTRSTNGTIVTLPGAPPLTLIRGESVVVVPGTIIDVGEGNVLEILAPE